MTIHKNTDLSACTSFGSGGKSEIFANVETVAQLENIITSQPKPFWILGSGSNTLISDKGLPGTTLHIEIKDMEVDHLHAVVGAGCNWDVFTQEVLKQDLWGVELMSGIPGTVGAAVVGNIAAYGQAVSDTLEWIEVLDINSEEPKTARMNASDLGLEYRSSIFSKGNAKGLVILRACFKLSAEPTTDLKYESALVVARENNFNPDNLNERRQIIMEARKRAGSLFDPSKKHLNAGSFFKNPLVSQETADMVMNFEEQSISKDRIAKQNKIHGGDKLRVSAAHVLLAAGFKRGQSWGGVRLHPDHVLKIENIGNASSQEIYDVAMHIIDTVKEKLGIELEPEVKFLGEFS